MRPVPPLADVFMLHCPVCVRTFRLRPIAPIRHLLLAIGMGGAGCDSTAMKTSPGEGPSSVTAGDTAGSDVAPVDADGDGYPSTEDCDDTDISVNPGATEQCNERDDNCNGEVDEDVQTMFYRDTDGDSYGDPDQPVWACMTSDGIVSDDTDCDDTDATIHPTALDECNEIDDDCDGVVDEDGEVPLYVDNDGDGWGQDGSPSSGCPEAGWATVDGDCDDSDSTSNPGVALDYCDGVNNDCDDEFDEDSKAGWSFVSVNTHNSNIYDIDPTTASISSLTTISSEIRINSMDVSENGVAFVHIASENQLGLFDACTGTATRLGSHGAGSIGGIAFGPSGRLFGIGAGDTLWEFDLSTGAATAIGPLGLDIGNSGMAWDCSTQTMFGADTNADVVFEIDLSTGQALNVQSTEVPFSSVGLEYDRESGLLLASSGTALYTVDPRTGATTSIGAFGVTNMDDLAWHPSCP